MGLWIVESVLIRGGLLEPRLPIEPFRVFAPSRLFLCLNFSSQALVRIFSLPSERPHVLAKKRAFSLIISSFNGCPWRW